MKKKEHFISTAEEFWNLSCKNDKLKSPSDIMIEFAKLHVEPALKAALINVDIDMNGTSKNQLPNPHFKIIEESILNAYPLKNIK